MKQENTNNESKRQVEKRLREIASKDGAWTKQERDYYDSHTNLPPSFYDSPNDGGDY